MFWTLVLACGGGSSAAIDDTGPEFPDEQTVQCRLTQGQCEEIWYSSPVVETYYDIDAFRSGCEASEGILRERPCHRGADDLFGICITQSFEWSDGEQYELRDVYYWEALEELQLIGEELILQCELAGGTWTD